MNCINTKSKEFQKLLEASKLPSFLLEMRIAKWQEQNGLDNFPKVEDIIQSNEVNTTLKAVDILQSDKAKQVFEKGKKVGWDLNKILTELQIPKDQKQLLLDLDITDREQLALELASNYSYTVEINTTTESIRSGSKKVEEDDYDTLYSPSENKYYSYSEEMGWMQSDKNNKNQEFDINPPEDAKPYRKNERFEDNYVDIDTQHYSNLTVPGGTNYTEQEIATPAIVPSIKGHAAFSTDSGIGWFRSDDKQDSTLQWGVYTPENELLASFKTEQEAKEFNNKRKDKDWNQVAYIDTNIKDTKTRRILEVQSDLFQKGRDKEWLSREMDSLTPEEVNNEPEWLRPIGTIVKSDSKKNAFLNLLIKDNNWVTFFIKSIIQDSAKKGYEKVLFPSGNTASKVEGHTTLEEFKKQKEDRLKGLQSAKIIEKEYESYNENTGETEILPFRVEYEENNKRYSLPYKNKEDAQKVIDSYSVEINQLKQELEQVEGPGGFGALKPIYNFYENTVTNILNKTYGKDNVKVITDEYGNTWNELTLDNNRDTSTILFNKVSSLLDPKITKEIFSITDNQFEKSVKNVDNSQANKQLLFNANNQNSLLTSEVLTNILEQIPENLTDEFKVLLDKASKILNNTKAKVEVSTLAEMSKKYDKVDSTVAMLYDANTNKIVISEEALTKLTSQEIVQSFIHEVVHAIVVKAIKNPQTFEEKQLRDLLVKAYNQYKDLAETKSNGDKSYGFESIDEFVAEIYSNPEFQNELKTIEKSFWSKFVDELRRLINLINTSKNRELVDAVLLINRVTNLVEQTNNSDFTGFAAESGIKFDAMFIRNTVLSESEGYNLDTIEKQIQNVLNKAKDVLNQNIAHYKAVTKSIKDPVKKQQWTKFVDNFDDTLNSLETLAEGDELTGILNYVNSLQKGVASLKSSFDKKEFTEEETIQVVHNYTKYLDSFTIHKDIQKLLSDIKVNNKFDSDTIDISEIENALDSVVSDYTKLKSEYSAFLKNAIKLKLSTLKYLPELETMWINKLKTEYKSSPKSISQTEWIANAMNTTYKEDIDADIEDYLNKLINNPSFDISIGTHFLSSAINTNSHLIQIFNQILNEVKEEINQTMKTKEFELKGLFDKLVKEKGSSSVSVLYKNLISKNPNGNYSLVNDIKNLSKIEKEVLTSLKDIQDFVDYSTYGKQSKKVKINGQVYYELPSITKSDLERVLEGDIKGTIKDKWTDLTTIKADDVEFRYKTDNDHNLIYNVPVRYRAKIEAKDQSLDVLTVYRLEYLNGVNFKVKTKAEKDLTTILDIAKSKDYYREEGGLKEYVKSTFTKNNEIELTPGEKSNTLKMLNSLLETNIYDIGHRYAGKTGKVDNNKLLSFFNGATASIGLSLNRFGATANVINAKAQVFLEGISKGVINNNNIKKAELLYSKEIFNGNLFNDLGQPVEKSFINQMNRMFDTFGFNQNAMNDFVKQGILKSYSNLGTLQFMHKTGEHWVQSVLTAAVLDSVKVMNSDNRFIDKKGNEVSEDKAASLLDMLYIDSKDGILKISDKVVYTTKSLTSKINEGGKEKINLLIERKIKDCFGNYNPTTQPEASRHIWGKLTLPFRRFYVEMATKRFKAFGSSSKTKDEMEANPRYKHYNYALQSYDEGTYTSLVRFLRHGVIPMLKQMKFHILSQEWEKLSDLERANIKHSVSEITATLVILPLIGMLLGNMLGGNDDDDEMIYFWMYQTRRLTTELAQFRNPSENIKMTRSPIPSMRLIENGIDVIGKTLNFWSWDEEMKSGPNKGDLKIGRAWSKMIPVLNQIDKNSKDLYKYQTAMFGSY